MLKRWLDGAESAKAIHDFHRAGDLYMTCYAATGLTAHRLSAAVMSLRLGYVSHAINELEMCCQSGCLLTKDQLDTAEEHLREARTLDSSAKQIAVQIAGSSEHMSPSWAVSSPLRAVGSPSWASNDPSFKPAYVSSLSTDHAARHEVKMAIGDIADFVAFELSHVEPMSESQPTASQFFRSAKKVPPNRRVIEEDRLAEGFQRELRCV